MGQSVSSPKDYLVNNNVSGSPAILTMGSAVFQTFTIWKTW